MGAKTVRVPTTVEIEMTPRMLAEAFCDMDDEDQAQFFIECAEIAKGWPHAGGMQWHFVGRHLATCECSNEDARNLVRDIHHAMSSI